MAKKKHYKAKRRSATRKASTRRRRRIGSAMALSPTSNLVKLGSAALGYLMADKINAPIDKAVGDKIDGKLVAAGQVGIGYMLALRKSGKKSLVTTILGGVMLGAGVKRAMQSFGIGGIGPYGRVPVIGAPYGPYGRTPVIAGGYSPSRSLNGYTPSRSLNKVMAGAGVMNGTGSGITSDQASGYME